MAIVAGFDVHRTQITFDALDTETGEVHRGRIAADPESVRGWVGRFEGQRVDVAVEACTGWLFVCEALREAGAVAHLAETDETHARRGKKRRAKTDRQDARWLRVLLAEGRLPEAWIPPAHVREWRTRTRLRKTLVDERTSWLQRIQATLFHHGVGGVPDQLLRVRGRAFLSELELPDAARERIEVALQMIDALDRQLAPLERDIRALARRQAGCRELMRHYGIGPVTATSIVAELGDVSRLSASRKAVRCAGLDVGVHRSDQHSRPGKLTRQGSPHLRWALYEAAPVGLRAPKPRPRRLPRTQGARAVAHQGDDDDRPQARPPLLPQPAPARPRRARTRHLVISPCPQRSLPPSPPVPDDTQASGQLPQVLRYPPTSGAPKETERPESIPAERPINHHVAGHQAVDPDKPGRPRNDRTHRNRRTPQPLTPELDNGPGSDKQHSDMRSGWSPVALCESWGPPRSTRSL